MNYGQLIQAYFERSVALQWYWTVFVLVIGGLAACSMFRQKRELVTTVIVTLLFSGFAFKNLGAIEATAAEREAIREAFRQVQANGPLASEIQLVREKLEPALPPYDIPGARYFHLACSILTIVYVWAKEWKRE